MNKENKREWIHESFPVGKKIIEKWLIENRFPELIIEIGNDIFFNLQEWERMIKEQQEYNIKRKKREQERCRNLLDTQ